MLYHLEAWFLFHDRFNRFQVPVISCYDKRTWSMKETESLHYKFRYHVVMMGLRSQESILTVVIHGTRWGRTSSLDMICFYDQISRLTRLYDMDCCTLQPIPEWILLSFDASDVWWCISYDDEDASETFH